MTSRLDLLLIHPGGAHGIYGDVGEDLIAVEPPLWPRLIAGYCLDREFTVKIIDAEAERLSPREVAEAVAWLDPQLACLCVYGHQPSASTQQMHGAGLTARAIKEARPEIPVMMLGGHVSALPERTLREEAVDFVCSGEGPITVAKLLFGMRNGTYMRMMVPGLWWMEGGEVQSTPAAPLIEDLGQMHGDAWHLLPMDRYRAHNWQCFGDLGARQPYASIYTSLGCPFRCHFCCINAPFKTNRYRTRHPGAVVVEIMRLRNEYGVRTFKIVDEMFVLKERHYAAIAEGLVAAGAAAGWNAAEELNIWAYARVDTIEPAKLALLRSAGFRWLAIGVESGSAHVRDGAKKAMREADIMGVVSEVQAAGINVIANYIFGLPDDDLDTMQETLELALELNTEFANFYSAMAYPGSPLYDQAIRAGWTLPASWRGYSQHNDDCRPLDTKHVMGAEVLRFRDQAFTAYFTSPNYLRMIEQKFGAETLAHMRGMTGYKLRRKLLEAA
jgi:anaerobic magnesium-protoporphyrin IX monomethyl ester cyclase